MRALENAPQAFTRARSGVVGGAVAGALVAIFGTLLAVIAHVGLRQIDTQAHERLATLAAAASAQVDAASHEAITTAGQTGSAEYEQAVARLVDLHNRLPVVQWMYTMRVVDGALRYVLDTAVSTRNTLGRGAAGASGVMDAVSDYTLQDEPDLLPDLSAGRIHINGRSYVYEGRPLRTAVAAIRDATGSPVAMVAVDVDVAEFGQARARFLRLILLTGVVGLALAGAIGWGVAWQHRKLAQLVGELERESITDALTGLNNRAYFNRAVEDAIPLARRQRRELVLLMFDIDHFKRINDTLGHPAGDEVLRTLGARVRTIVRGGDICCRIGGEEFAVLMWGVTLEDADVLYRRLRAVLQEPIVITGNPLLVTISAGASQLSDRLGSATELMRTADLALYAAKARGRDQLVRYAGGEVSTD